MTPETGTRIATWVVVAGLAALVAVVVFGVPARSLFLLGAALICPVSMLFMHGAHGATAGHPENHHADRPGHLHGAPTYTAHPKSAAEVAGRCDLPNEP